MPVQQDVPPEERVVAAGSGGETRRGQDAAFGQLPGPACQVQRAEQTQARDLRLAGEEQEALVAGDLDSSYARFAASRPACGSR